MTIISVEYNGDEPVAITAHKFEDEPGRERALARLRAQYERMGLANEVHFLSEDELTQFTAMDQNSARQFLIGLRKQKTE